MCRQHCSIVFSKRSPETCLTAVWYYTAHLEKSLTKHSVQLLIIQIAFYKQFRFADSTISPIQKRMSQSNIYTSAISNMLVHHKRMNKNKRQLYIFHRFYFASPWWHWEFNWKKSCNSENADIHYNPTMKVFTLSLSVEMASPFCHLNLLGYVVTS